MESYCDEQFKSMRYGYNPNHDAALRNATTPFYQNTKDHNGA